MRKEVREVIAYAESFGFRLIDKAGRAKHIKMQHQENGALIVFSSTPSRPSWRRNIEADIRRFAKHGRPHPER